MRNNRRTPFPRNGVRFCCSGTGFAAYASLRCDGKQRIPQLGKHYPKQIDLIHCPAAGNGICDRRNGCRQLTGIHSMITSNISICGENRQCFFLHAHNLYESLLG